MHETKTVSIERHRAVPELGIDDVIAFLYRQGLLILGAAVVAAVVSAVLVMLQPRSYQSTATLVIFPPQVSSELKPATLSVLGLQQLLESGAVVLATKERLVTEGKLSAEDPLGLPSQVSSRIFVSRRSEDKELAPMIQAFGRGETPETAADIANTWALVFLESMRDLVTGSTAATVGFVDSQYAEQRDALIVEENGLVSQEAERRREEDTLAIEWLRRIGAYQAKASEELAAYRAETSELVESYRGEKNLETRQSQLEAMRKALVLLQEEQSSVEASLQKVDLTLASLREQAKNTPASRSFQKAITDDALWAQLEREDGGIDWQKLKGLSLTSEERNPVFDEMMQRIAWASAEFAALKPRSTQLGTQIDQLLKSMAATESSLRADQAGLTGLEETRAAGLERLDVEQITELEALEQQRDQVLEVYRNETDNIVRQLNRSIDQRKTLFSELAKNYNEAVIAKAQADLEEVRLGARAVPSDRPLPRQLVLKAILAGIVGALIGLLIALINDRRRLGYEV